VENPDETQRARIYQTARDALVRNLESRGLTDPDQVRTQISRLKDMIVRIEADYDGQAPMAAPTAPAAPAAPERAPHDQSGTEAPASGPVRSAPDIRMDREQASSRPDPDAGPAFGFSPAAERAQPSGEAPEIQVTHAGEPAERSAPDQRLDPRVDAPRQTHPSAFPSLEGESRQADTPPFEPGPAPASAVSRDTSGSEIASPAIDDGLTLPPPRADDRKTGQADKRGLFSKRDRKTEPKKKRRERHVFASAFSSLVLLSFLGIGVWWLYDSGAFNADWDTSVPNPPPNVSSEDYSGEGSAPRPLNPESGFSGSWTTIYVPRSGDTLSTGSLASAEISGSETGSVLTVTSADSGEDGEVSLPIDASALQQMAGRPSVIALTVRAASEETTPFYVTCDFGTLGDCGRRRFDAESQATDALIEMDFTRQLAPSESGTISINSDIAGKGRSIEIFAIRIRRAS
jgi:hypothetical protein